MKNLLSIIIPTFNTKKEKLISCLDSIAAEIKKVGMPFCEILLIDDGSEKEYANWLDSIAERYLLTIIHQDNKGEAGARNTGIDRAQGKYIMFVDSDDVIPHGWVDFSLKLGEKYNADIVSGRFVVTDELNPETNKDIKEKVFQGTEIDLIQRDQLLSQTKLLEGLEYIDYGVCAKLYLKTLIGSYRFEEGVQLSVDQIFNHAMIKKCRKYVLTNALSYYYITNNESVSHVLRKDAVKIMMNSLEKVRKFLRNDTYILTAYYYHVTRDLIRAIDMECFDDPSKTSFNQKIMIIKSSMHNKLAEEAVSSLKYKDYPVKKHFIYGFEIKHKMTHIFWLTRKLVISFERNNK